jgi:hypothetical protein
MADCLSSDSLIVPRMLGAFAVEVVDGAGDGTIELVDALKGLVGEVVTLEIAPGALDVVELRSVLGQPLDGDPGPLLEGGAGQFADMDRSVVEDEDDRLGRSAGSRRVEIIDAFEQADEVGAALGRTALDDQPTGGVIERAEQGQLARLAGCGHAQIVSVVPAPSRTPIDKGRLGDLDGDRGRGTADGAALRSASLPLSRLPRARQKVGDRGNPVADRHARARICVNQNRRAPHRRRGLRKVIRVASASRRRFRPRPVAQVAAGDSVVQDLKDATCR